MTNLQEAFKAAAAADSGTAEVAGHLFGTSLRRHRATRRPLRLGRTWKRRPVAPEGAGSRPLR